MSHTIVVGGGVVGASLAWELAQRGRRVTVLEASEGLNGGASWAGAGILPAVAQRNVLDPYEQLRSMSHGLHAEWAERLRALTGIDTGFRRCGGIYLARSVAESATLTANQFWWETHAIEHQRWSAAQLLAAEPALTSSVAEIRSAWFLPDECQLRNPRHLRALAAACGLQGVSWKSDTRVEKIEPTAAGDILFITNRGPMVAQQACICSGAWARLTLEQLGISTGIMPVRGQIVLYACPTPLIRSVVNEGHRYLVAREDGYLLAGSVEEEVGYVVETTAAAIEHIKHWAESILPVLKNYSVARTWAGLRPGSFDGLPYIGRIPGMQNLFLAAGHFRSGLHLSCATAVAMANEMEGIPNTIDLQPFRVGRG